MLQHVSDPAVVILKPAFSERL